MGPPLLGMLVRQSQAPEWNRTSANFPHSQGPVARRELRHSLRFCAPEGFYPRQGVTPAFGVRGKATMSTKCSSGAGPYPLCPFGTSPLDKGSRPRRRFGDFAAGGKVTRRPHCARRRVLERNRRKAAALSAEMAAKFPAKTAEPARRGRRALQGPETCPLIRLAFGQPPIPISSVASRHHPYPFWPSAISP